MKTRTISGACFVAIITGFFVLRQHVDARFFLVLLWLFCAIGTFETARAGKDKTTAFEFYAGVFFGVTILPVYFGIETLFTAYGTVAANFYITLFAAVILIEALIAKKTEGLGWALLPVFYPSIFLVLMTRLNYFEEPFGFIGLLLVFVISPCADTMAYLVGMTYGKIKKGNVKKLCPRLSPNKTVAGAIGGLIGGTAGSLIVYAIFKPDLGLNLPVLFFALTGLILALFTEIGDLLESFVKRRAGIKDMGRIMPGHGGIMDRIDGISLAGAVSLIIFTVIRL